MSKISLESDEEEAMRALQQRVRKAVSCEMVVTNSKKYDSKAKRKVKKAIQEIGGQTRTLKLHADERIGRTIPCDHQIIRCMVEYATATINQFRMIKKKSTPQEALRGKHTRENEL